MAQYIIPATFANENGFKSGLTPTITIRQWDDVNLAYIDKISATMEDKGLGDYIYIFTDYDKIKLYTYKIDGGSDELTSRYFSGNNELDYYSNKEDYGSQFRGAIGGLSDGLYKELKKILLLLENSKPKDVDLLPIMSILEEIKNKEYPENNNEEILEALEYKLSDKSDKIEIISTIKSNEANFAKVNEQNREIITNMLEQIKSDSETIKELKKYIEKLIARGDISQDKDFNKILKKINKEKEGEKLIKEIEEQLLLNDENFISLLDD